MIVRTLLNWLYPRSLRCALCEEDSAPKRVAMCDRCAALLPPPASDRLEVAGITLLRCAYQYEEPLRDKIHAFKYENQRYLATFFAGLIVPQLPREGLLLPVPLHPVRLKERGFSQTNELVLELAKLSNLPYNLKALRRIRDTPSQTHLSAVERRENVRGAFASQHPLEGQSVILVDDVASTGSTLSECAQVALAAGARRVDAVVIAE